MEVKFSNLLPWLLMVIALFWSWKLNVLALPKDEGGHKTCDNEERYENQVMCEDKDFGALVPYPDNCSLFLVCDCLYPTVKICPANLWWDNITQLCNYPQAVDCIYYSIETPVPTDGTTRITKEPTSSTEEITSESSARTEEPTTTSSSNIPTSSWDPPPAPPGISEDYCHNVKDGTLFPYPYDCQAYINCTFGWPVLNYCIEDKVFNKYLLICDTPDEADCEELPLPTTTTEISTTTTEISTTTTVIPTTSTTEGDVVCGPAPEGINDDYCQLRGNGFYKYPYNCSGYLACENGCTNLDYCQPDKLFNMWLYICDTPNSVYCDPIPLPTTTGPNDKTTTSIPTTLSTRTTLPSGGFTTTESSTTEVASTTTPGLPSDVDPNDCKDLPDGTLIAYIGNCSEYLICKNNQVEMGSCPPPLLFNPDWRVCDDPDDVVCLADRTTTPIPTTKPTTTTEKTTIATTTTTEATTLGPDQFCQGQEIGASFPYTEDCSKYYLCLGNGQWMIAPCIYNSYFDPKTGECGPNVSPDACRASQSTTTSTTSEATTTERVTTPKTTTREPTTTEKTTTTTVAPDTGICSGRNENENIAYPNKCNKYIVCISPIPIAFFCPDDTFFSSKLQKCIESWEESDCEGDQSTTTSEPGYTRPPPEPTMCTNSSRNTFPYSENCQWFIRCVDDYIYMMDVCNCGEYYDPVTEKCGAGVPSDACRWDYTSTTSTTSEPTTTTAVTRPPPQKGPCDDVEDGALVPYPNDCSKYIKCDRPIAVANDCDEGNEFSVELGKCVDASLANCSITTTAKPSESTTTPSEAEPSSSTTAPTTEKSTVLTTESSTEVTTESTTELSTASSTELTTDLSTVSSTEYPAESTTVESSSTESGTTSIDCTTTPKPAEGICGGKTDNSSVPYPRNCSKYIKCQYPIPVGYDCPNGLEFSPTELSCMDPELAGCSPKVTTPGLSTLTTEALNTTESTTTPSITEITTVSTTPKTTTSESTTTRESTSESTSESTTLLTTPQITTTEPTTILTTPRTTTPEPTTTTEITTVSTTPMTTTTESTTVSTTTLSTTILTTPRTTTPESTTTTEITKTSTTPMTTTTESTTNSTTTESTTVSTTTESTTFSTTTESKTTTAPPPVTLDPYTPNICCGQPLGTLLAYPNDCSRYVVCDYPIPYAVDCVEGTVFDEKLLQCTATPNERCLFAEF
ncbi:flocculation protein FLO11 isoform X2 [Drosophila ficusphila]|uniref:flocculation protein FLO11 isoform X2 n=1 Tax=Drosophila ficusphila TaxID=30025 RepID=UPI0007E5C94C|nr:flocculation protein FLO11 isoform X2 [Drosophila ficusphila]